MTRARAFTDILPLDLIHIILLRVPIRHLARLRCVSKLWCSLISDPDFAEFHFHHSSAANKVCFLIENPVMAYLVYLDDNDASQKEVCPPFEKEPPYEFAVLGSCRGFILLDRPPHFIVAWNPLTGFSKRISYSHVVPYKYYDIRFIYHWRLHGFGYDASQDDYLVVVAWKDSKSLEDHLECLSMRTNSWINLDAVLPNPLGFYHGHSRGLFFNGAIHWVSYYLKDYRDAILYFDLKERTFSMISAPEQLGKSSYPYPGHGLTLLGGCLALYLNSDSCNTEIWVMKEYKVHSSWTLYQIPCKVFLPLGLSSNGDIIGRGYDKLEYFIYNVRGDLLKDFKNPRCPLPICGTVTVYMESLLPLPSDIKNKDN